jgi:hypothetical protein
MARAGRQRVEEHYNSARLNDQLVQLYRRLLGNSGSEISAFKADGAAHGTISGDSWANSSRN